VLLAQVLGQQEGTVCQRLREWYLEARAKRGAQRRDLDVTTCFGPLLGWIVRLLLSAERRLAFALDATTLGGRWTVLTVSVRVAGLCDSGGVEGAARPGQRLLASLLGELVGEPSGACACRLAGAGPGGSGLICPTFCLR
jgi:hypothetical protein